MVSPAADARLRLRISAVSGGVKVTAERRADVVVDAVAPPSHGGRRRRGPGGATVGLASTCGARRAPTSSSAPGRAGSSSWGASARSAITSQSGSIRVADGGRGRSAHGVGHGGARRVRRAMPRLDDERTHHGGHDRRRGDLHHVGFGGDRRQWRGRVPGAFGQRHASPSASSARGARQGQHRLRIDHDPTSRPACAPPCGRPAAARVKSSFEAGDDVAHRHRQRERHRPARLGLMAASTRTPAEAGRGHHRVHRHRRLHRVHGHTRRRRGVAAAGDPGPARAVGAPRRGAGRQGARRRSAALVPRTGERAAQRVRAAPRLRGGVGGNRAPVVDPGRHAPRHRPSSAATTSIGHDVNVASRIVDVAAPGEVLVSDAVHAGVDPSAAHVCFTELGPVVMKGIPEPIRLWRASAG